MKPSKLCRKNKVLLSILVVFVILLIAGTVYLSDYYRADDTALACANTAVIIDGNIVFAPEEPIAGVIFYPGGMVQAESYAPLMQALAENNILAVLVPMPANLAVFGVNEADGIMAEFPEIDAWYMAGHSLGGAMAATYISENATDFDGLILLAAYSTVDVSHTDLSVLSIYGDRDGVLNMESYEQYIGNLPADFSEVIIEGGCHAYFGNYGEQKGDGEALITRKEQIEKTVDAILEVVDQ